jgi:hypothetical protein
LTLRSFALNRAARLTRAKLQGRRGNTLFAKGLLMRTSNAVQDAVYASGDTRLIERFEP